MEKSIPLKTETIIDVELTTLQKQYYRALYERNRMFLLKGSKVGGVTNNESLSPEKFNPSTLFLARSSGYFQRERAEAVEVLAYPLPPMPISPCPNL